MKDFIEKIYYSFPRWFEDKILWNVKKPYYWLRYGFDVRDTWSLDFSMCKWLLPRLKEFKKRSNGFPACNDLDKRAMTWDRWNYYISLMIYWCEHVVNDDEPIYKKKVSKRVIEKYPEAEKWMSEENRIAKRTFDLGFKCFTTYFHSLWW